MKMNFRLIAKLGLLVVIIGFCMPIACDMNGFQIANISMENNDVFTGILLYLLFISAIVGLLIAVFILMNKKLPVMCDWIAIIVCIASGLIVYFSKFNSSGFKLQSGAYVILIGWVIALVCQLLSSFGKRR